MQIDFLLLWNQDVLDTNVNQISNDSLLENRLAISFFINAFFFYVHWCFACIYICVRVLYPM